MKTDGTVFSAHHHHHVVVQQLLVEQMNVGNHFLNKVFRLVLGARAASAWLQPPTQHDWTAALQGRSFANGLFSSAPEGCAQFIPYSLVSGDGEVAGGVWGLK